MHKYIVTGKVHPEKVNFTLGFIHELTIDIPDIKLKGVVKIQIQNSKIDISFESLSDYSKSQTCNLETLKNYIYDSVALLVDTWCYVNSFCYDIEITKIQCPELNIDYIFPVRGEWNISKTQQEASEEFNKIIQSHTNKNTYNLLMILADFKRAIKYPAMTASFCFRAIESIRISYFENFKESNKGKRKSNGWLKLRKELNLQKSDFDQIQYYATPNRHGYYPSITYKEREEIMNFTRKIIDEFIDWHNKKISN